MVLPIDTFYEKTIVRPLGLFLDTPFEIYILHRDLTLIGIRCHTFDGESVDSVEPDYHGIMRWRDADIRWIAHKPAQGLLSTLC